MRNRTFFFGVLLGTALFVYLVSSFLIATLDVTLWENYHRFFAVVAYWLLLKELLDRTPTAKVSNAEEAEETITQKNVTSEEKEPEVEQSHTQ